MNCIYIILHENAYDGLDYPSDYYYTSNDEAEKECLELNIRHYGTNKKHYSFFVHEMELKTK